MIEIFFLSYFFGKPDQRSNSRVDYSNLSDLKVTKESERGLNGGVFRIVFQSFVRITHLTHTFLGTTIFEAMIVIWPIWLIQRDEVTKKWIEKIEKYKSISCSTCRLFRNHRFNFARKEFLATCIFEAYCLSSSWRVKKFFEYAPIKLLRVSALLVSRESAMDSLCNLSFLLRRSYFSMRNLHT